MGPLYYIFMGLLLLGLLSFASYRKRQARMNTGGRGRRYTPRPKKKKKSEPAFAFEMAIEQVFDIKNIPRVTVVGTITHGTITVGQPAILRKESSKYAVKVEKIERKSKERDVAKKGKGYRITLSGISKHFITPGDQLVVDAPE